MKKYHIFGYFRFRSKGLIFSQVNVAIKELEYVKLINYTKYNPQITLTQAGLSLNVAQLDVELYVRDKAKAYWEESSAKRKIKHSITSNSEVDDEEADADADVIGNDPVDDFKTKLQEAINNMSPAKFEQFSRALLTEMGVKFTKVLKFQMMVVQMVMDIIVMKMILGLHEQLFNVSIIIRVKSENLRLINSLVL